MSERHTPGPWIHHVTSVYDNEPRGFVKVAEEGVSDPSNLVTVATCWDASEGEVEGWAGEVEANARLIAAAPDLLAALYYALNNGDDWRAMADRAIAKATGGESA